MNPDESLDAAQEGLADLYAVEKAAGRHGAIAEHDEVLGRGLGHGFLDAHHQSVDRAEEPLPMREDGLVHWVLGIGILGHGVQEGAAAKTGGLDVLGDRLGNGPECLRCSPRSA
jgi:hypothetical protein